MLSRFSCRGFSAVAVLCFAGCFHQPEVDIGKIKCETDENCPVGYACVDKNGDVPPFGHCVPSGASPTDAFVPTPVPLDTAATEAVSAIDGNPSIDLPRNSDLADATNEANPASDGLFADLSDAARDFPTNADDAADGPISGDDGMSSETNPPDMPILGAGGAMGSGGATETGGSMSRGGASGALGSGGANGTGGAVGTGGVIESGGAAGTSSGVGTGGLVGTGGAVGTGGLVGTGGAVGTGGLVGTGGVVGTGGMGTGGVVGTGGMGTGGVVGTGGTTVPACSPVCTADQDCMNGSCILRWGGMTCSVTADCPSYATCCSGADETCDGTRLPTGDGTNAGEFVVSGDGLTVTDTITGLVWQRDGSGTRAGCTGAGTLTCTWDEANAYCAGLVLGGVSGWRMPAAMELSTIVAFNRSNPSIDTAVFPSTPAIPFWTSSPNAASDYPLYVHFKYGWSALMGRINWNRVRCVR
jgi:hypothetical protein